MDGSMIQCMRSVQNTQSHTDRSRILAEEVGVIANGCRISLDVNNDILKLIVEVTA